MRAAALLLFAAPALGAAPAHTNTALDEVKGSDLTGQIHVLTGGDTGIGYQTALALASVHAEVIILSYDAAGNGAKAAANITRITGNTKVSVIAIDLSELANVRTCAANILKQTSNKINVLVCDAGMGVNSESLPPLTGDGFDRVFEVNYIGHFLLVELLLPALRTSKGRIINVASASSFEGCSWANLPSSCSAIASLEQTAKHTPQGNNSAGVPASNYGVSKAMQVFHAAELAKREGPNGVSAFSLHPGVVGTPMTKKLPPAVAKKWCGSQLPCPMTAPEGAATPAYLASAPDAALTKENGKYFSTVLLGKEKSARSVVTVYSLEHPGKEAEYQAQVYAMTLNWVGQN